MKALFMTFLFVSTTTFAAAPNLGVAPVIAAKSNHAFPVTTVELTAQIACYEHVLGTISDIESNGEAVIGVIVKSNLVPGTPVCMGLSQQKFKVKVSAPVLRQIRILGGEGVTIQ